ncbi:ATP-binding protein [Streptomyces tropicalis]|uniref:ATP-binding protein n=1 Tax=Streptomyces tropicalis TaxID=3034234 RepID=A0ABT5ZYA6_9ACTN|nr:ATP-binding protein [Streptomyces tropicalis]MDF3297370.1 ATP-binding protein [Streptomyces tropicalis]
MPARTTPRDPVTVRTFVRRFGATPRGARLARHLVLRRLDAWRIPHGSAPSDAVAVIVAELAANAVTHGRVPGRDFEVRLSLVTGGVRVEVTDTRSGPPLPPGPRDLRPPDPLAERGRGLALVDALAARWEVCERVPPPGKTIRAEIDLPPGWHRRRVPDRDAVPE